MKHSYLFFALALCLFMSCKKDKPKPKVEIIDNRPPEEVVETLTEELAEADSISSFTNALKKVTLTKEETAQGLTVFAPLNDAASASTSAASVSKEKTANRVSSTETGTSADPDELSDTEIKDHIVKGIFKSADLTDGKILTSLSGKELKITRAGDSIWINGVMISGAEVTSGSKEAIYVVQKPLSNTTVNDVPVIAGSIEITVWNALAWAPEKPRGEVAADADVVLYRSQQDYTNSIPAYQGKTNAEGKIKFSNLPAGRYYIEVSKDDLSNIFYESEQPQNGLYRGLAAAGIVQSQADADTSATQSGDAQPGNFKWVDLNGDRTIDNSDFTALPYESAETGDGINAKISVLIGYNNNLAMGPVRSESQALDLLESAETGISTWHQNMVMLDGVLSDDADAGGLPVAYQEIDHFSFTPANTIITQNWITAYQQISTLNKLIRDIPNVSMSKGNEILAQARALRAYIYIQLLTYFGHVPLQTDVTLEADASNSNSQQVYDLVKNDLSSAVDMLPQSGGSNAAELNAVSVKALLAKLALSDKEYATAANYTGFIINSGQYQLEANTSGIFTGSSKETIWDNSGSLSGLFKTYFDNRATCPYIRFAEVLLIAAEANLESANMEQALQYLNIIRMRRGMSQVNPGMSQEETRNALQDTWKAEMSKEGNRFANLVRWGTAGQVLGSKGYSDPKHQLLPIPMAIIDQYPSLIQNPGY